MLKENFVSGVGVDRYGANFKFYREAAYPLRYGFDITSSNAHNTPIQIFSTAGVITGLFYLALLATILVLGLRGLLKLEKNAQLVLLGLISSWVGFQAQSFISIDNVGISVWGWLLGGCILGISNSDNFKQAINESSKKRVNKVDINLLQPIVAVIVLLPITYLSYNLLQAEQDTFNTKNYTNPNAPQNKTPVLEYAYQVINNKYADPYYKFIVALSMYEMGNKNEALFEITKLLKNDPKNLTFLNALALLKPVDSELTMILELREQILKYDPWNANNYLELCKLYKLSQNKNGVEQMVNQINQFIPNSSIAVEAQKILASFE
jgi:tetratricopeptide (TPR) repeat protein